MSADLTWQLIRGQNAFIVQNKKVANGACFSKEAGNLMGKHAYKWSGIANKRTVDVAQSKGDRAGVVLTMKVKGAGKKPKTATRSVTLARGARKAIKAVTGQTAGQFYRADLTKVRAPSLLTIAGWASLARTRLQCSIRVRFGLGGMDA